MPRYCCVPGCTNRHGHLFPVSEELQMMWRVAINRCDAAGMLWEPNIDNSVVCSHHFLESDYVQRYKKRVLKEGAVPSVFSPQNKVISRDPRRKRSGIILTDTDGSLPVIKEVNFYDADQEQQPGRQTNDGIECTRNTKKAPICINNYINDPKAVQYFTGFENYSHFRLFYDSLEPGLNELEYQCHLLPLEDQLFLTLIKLRLFLDHQLLSYFFEVSSDLVSKIFTAWTNYIYLQLKKMDIWPCKGVVVDTMPAGIKRTYPSTRVIIGSTEIPIETPSDIDAQEQTFSSCENRHTIKVLVGITPNGMVSYISDCFGGSATDRQVIEQSSLYENASTLFERHDSIMADKGILVQDLFAPFGVSVNVPKLRKRKTKLYKTERLEDVTVPLECTPIERVINYAKKYKILQGVIPCSLLPLSNRIVFICLILVNFRKTTMLTEALGMRDISDLVVSSDKQDSFVLNLK